MEFREPEALVRNTRSEFLASASGSLKSNNSPSCGLSGKLFSFGEKRSQSRFTQTRYHAG